MPAIQYEHNHMYTHVKKKKIHDAKHTMNIRTLKQNKTEKRELDCVSCDCVRKFRRRPSLKIKFSQMIFSLFSFSYFHQNTQNDSRNVERKYIVPVLYT